MRPLQTLPIILALNTNTAVAFTGRSSHVTTVSSVRRENLNMPMSTSVSKKSVVPMFGRRKDSSGRLQMSTIAIEEEQPEKKSIWKKVCEFEIV